MWPGPNRWSGRVVFVGGWLGCWAVGPSEFLAVGRAQIKARCNIHWIPSLPAPQSKRHGILSGFRIDQLAFAPSLDADLLVWIAADRLLCWSRKFERPRHIKCWKGGFEWGASCLFLVGTFLFYRLGMMDRL